MDLWNSDFSNFIPWIAFITGLGGSLHCIGMCGGLVAASCHNHSQIMRYQLGRLLGYLFLGAVGGSLGALISIKSSHLFLDLAPSLAIGLVFIFWGVQSLRGKKTFKGGPNFLARGYQKLWNKFIANNRSAARSFMIGTLSIFLPCGFLYAIVLGTMATQSTLMALTGMLFFWLGTLPAMLVAPAFVHKVLGPFRAKKPKIYAVSLLLIGLGTIGVRALDTVNHAPKQVIPIESCH